MSISISMTKPPPPPLHAASPSFVPRNSPRPGSPALAAGSSNQRSSSIASSRPASPLTPRLSGMERRGSQLRNEVREVPPKDAQAILRILSNLPAPLPASLPPTFLPTPSPSPPNSHRPLTTFSDYARRNKRLRRRRRSRSASLSSSDDADAGQDEQQQEEQEEGEIKPAIGLGLGLEGRPSNKKRKSSPGSAGGMRKSGLRNEVEREREGEKHPRLERDKDGEGDVLGQKKIEWTREQWRDAALDYRARALILKRHGDAYQRTDSARPRYTARLPADALKGLLCLTDAALLWLYAYHCEEQSGSGHARGSRYDESRGLRDFVRSMWEKFVRRDDEPEEERDRARGMVGLMHLIEAVVLYHVSAEELSQLSKRGAQLAANPSHGPSPSDTSTSNSPPTTSTQAHNPSPSNHNQHSPTSTSSTSAVPPDLLALISHSTNQSLKAAQTLQTARHHLSTRLLRSQFPRTFEAAITGDLSDQALPPPEDLLGAAKQLDVDVVNRFAWPIELGMCCPVAHVAVFGRGLVKEFAETSGRTWEVVVKE
ncbi:hypothetical protein BCR39DRAFT_525858 [Naematelia encephala]|uniref:Uncharacterized protein n=1 Tax=Naematelia encephala TaxID=71784 RepID=A0A1Y2B9T4_9TREE|nr:hypothetical protein BCR39DRAFT_525858 [Naematelia encephala]